MKIKEYLLQIRKYDKIIDNKIRDREQIRSMLLSITVELKEDKVQTSLVGDSFGDGIAKLVDLEKDIDSAIDKFVDLKREIISAIDNLEKVEQADILYKRYLQYDRDNGYKLKTWEEIAVEMGYSYQWVCKIHGRALQNLEKIINAKS